MVRDSVISAPTVGGPAPRSPLKRGGRKREDEKRRRFISEESF